MTTTIQLPPEIEERLNSMAKKTGIPDELLLQAIENGLYDVRDYYAAHETLERIRRGEEQTYTSAEVSAYLGLDRIPMAMKPKRTLRDAFLILAYREYSESFFATQWLSGTSEQSLTGRFERYFVELFTNSLESWEEDDLPALRSVGERLLDALEVVQEGP